MKLQINSDGYTHLLNDAGQAVYCIKRTPATTIVPDKLGQPQALVIPTLTNFCGDHCPFFSVEPSENKTALVNLCHDHVRGVSEILEEPKQKNSSLNLIK